MLRGRPDPVAAVIRVDADLDEACASPWPSGVRTVNAWRPTLIFAYVLEPCASSVPFDWLLIFNHRDLVAEVIELVRPAARTTRAVNISVPPSRLCSTGLRLCASLGAQMNLISPHPAATPVEAALVCRRSCILGGRRRTEYRRSTRSEPVPTLGPEQEPVSLNHRPVPCCVCACLFQV